MYKEEQVSAYAKFRAAGKELGRREIYLDDLSEADLYGDLVKQALITNTLPQFPENVISVHSPTTNVFKRIKEIQDAITTQSAGTSNKIVAPFKKGVSQTPRIKVASFTYETSQSSSLLLKFFAGQTGTLLAFSVYPDESFEELLIKLLSHASVIHRLEIANRLREIYEALTYYPEDPQTMSMESLGNFVNFIIFKNKLKRPLIAITPDMNILAEWRDQERKRTFNVHFLANGEVQFVILKPNDKHPDKTTRVTGITTPDQLMHEVEPYNVLALAEDCI